MSHGNKKNAQRKRGYFKRSRKYVIFFLLVGPALALRISLAVYPFLQTVYMSFFELNLLSQVDRYAGIQNFIHLFGDSTTRSIFSFTTVFIVVSTALQLVLGMLIASLLNARIVGRQIGRTINLIPWAIPMVAAGLAFRWMLDDQYGLITDLIYRITGTRSAFLVYPTSAQIAVILVNVWKNVPFMAIVFLAGLQNVPAELYEAAKIDGATAFQAYRKITIPLSIPLVITLGLFTIIWQLATFDLVYVMTGGGPGVATTVLAFRIFQRGMLWFDWGMASALSVYLIFIVGVVGVLGIYLFRKYEVTL